jgi:hypothetical protein
MTNRHERRVRAKRFRELQRKFDEALSELSDEEREGLLQEILEDGKPEKPH